ncbi:MAG: Na+/H+ antiporter NhaA [Leucobacter sp.]
MARTSASGAQRRKTPRGATSKMVRVGAFLRTEAAGGALLLVAAAVALIWANSPWADSYSAMQQTRVGGEPLGLHLDLTLSAWAADGLLAIFFFVVGLELKREFVIGELRDPRRAALPIAAAVGGMVVPAIIFIAFTAGMADGASRGWAIPTATDIAFAVAVLAVVSKHLPPALRMFLLALAVVDDLFAITIIAVFYTDTISVWALAAAVVPLALFALCMSKGIRSWWILIPLAAATWVFIHESGVHATVAGVLLGFAVPVRNRDGTDKSTQRGPAEHLEHRFQPLSAGIAIPLFAFFAAGVSIGGLTGFSAALGDPVVLGIICGLVVGKPIGVLGATWIVTRMTKADRDDALHRIDLLGVALLAGIGFTVSLLIGELAYAPDASRADHVKIGVLTASLLAAALATTVLGLRNRHYRRTRQYAAGADPTRQGRHGH